MHRIHTFVFSTLVLLAAGTMGRAAVVPLAFYHLGEADAGAVSGGAGATLTVDSVNSDNLTKAGTPVYIAGSASILAMNFGVANSTSFYASTTPVATGGTNFGLEGWFRIDDTTGTQVLVLNGNGATSGTGLLMSGGKLSMLIPGISVTQTSITPNAGQWFYAALVNTAGTNTVYYNDGSGTQTTSTTSATFNTPTGGINIGGQTGQNYLKGAADEVRFFTFTPGNFSTADLLVPEPATGTLLIASALGLTLRRRRNGMTSQI